MKSPRANAIKGFIAHRLHAQHPWKRSPQKQAGTGLRPEERTMSNPLLSDEDGEDTTDECFGFILCLAVTLIALMIGTVILYFHYGAKLKPTVSPVLPKFRDFEGPESLRNRSRRPISEPEESLTTRRPGDTYWVQFAQRPSSVDFPWMEGCNSPPCLSIQHRLLTTIRAQMNPCSDLNIFTCDVQPPPVIVAKQAGDNERDENAEKLAGHFDAAYVVARNLPLVRPQELSLRPVMIFLCARYGRNPKMLLDEVKAFTGYFKLNLWDLREDPTEDAFVRMLQLSLEYGLHPIVSFVRHFRFTRDPSEPFELQINITERARVFFKKWDYQRWRIFYFRSKEIYIYNFDPLWEGDKEVAEILQQEVDPVSNETYDDTLQPMKIAELENYTEGNITADRWKELLVKYGRSPFDLYDEVHANRRALALVGYFSRGNRLNMRRELSWHLTLLLLAPKASLVDMLNNALSGTEDIHETTTEEVCERMADYALMFPGGVMNIDHPEYRVPVERLLKVAAMVASVMETLSSITQPAASQAQNRTTLGLALEYPDSARSAESIYYYAGSDVLNQHFLYLWLTELRIRYVQPPLVQAAFEALRRAGDSPRRLFRRFRPPYFYDGGLDSYNYATLGQATDEKPVAPFNESSLRGTPLQHSMAARLAYLTWKRLPGSSKARLPGLFLAPIVLFFLQHCALGCARGGPLGTGYREDRCAVLMRGWGAIGDHIPCRHEYLPDDFNRCRHL